MLKTAPQYKCLGLFHAGGVPFQEPFVFGRSASVGLSSSFTYARLVEEGGCGSVFELTHLKDTLVCFVSYLKALILLSIFTSFHKAHNCIDHIVVL